LAFPILAVRDYQDIAQSVSDDLRKIGIPSEVQVVEFSTLRMRYLKTGKFSAVLWSRSVGPDPECILSWHSKGPLNFSRFNDVDMDRALSEGRRGTAKAERITAYNRVQTILSTQVPWVFLIHPDLLIARSGQLHNVMMPGQEKSGLPWDNPLFNA